MNNTVEDIEDFDEVSKHPIDIEYEKSFSDCLILH